METIISILAELSIAKWISLLVVVLIFLILFRNEIGERIIKGVEVKKGNVVDVKHIPNKTILGLLVAVAIVFIIIIILI